MKRKNFQGRVETLADSCEADYLVILICGRCETKRQMHPYRLISANRKLTGAKLKQPLKGFFCKTCKSSVSVTIYCTYNHPGG